MTSTNDEAATTIIKSDRTGRPRYSPEYREEVLDAYEASGMSGPAFSRHCGVKYPTFAGWVSKRRRGDGAPADAPSRSGSFVLAEFSGEPDGGALRVSFPGGSAAELASPSQAALLAALIKALA